MPRCRRCRMAMKISRRTHPPARHRTDTRPPRRSRSETSPRRPRRAHRHRQANVVADLTERVQQQWDNGTLGDGSEVRDALREMVDHKTSEMDLDALYQSLKQSNYTDVGVERAAQTQLLGSATREANPFRSVLEAIAHFAIQSDVFEQLQRRGILG